MKITKSRLAELVREVVQEEKAEYEKFFRAMLKKHGVSSPAELSDEEKKKFFNQVDAEYKAKHEGNAFGAAVVAAKKAGEDEFEVGGKKYKVEESAGCGCGCGGGCSTSITEDFNSKDSTFEKVYSLFDKKDYFNAKGLAKTQIGNFERALQKKDRGALQILNNFKGDMDKAKEYITQVISDRKKAQAFGDYQNFKDAVDSIVRGRPKSSAVEFIKGRAHNNRQKYTMALYSALRGKKFTNYKDIHADVDSLIGESVTEGRAFVAAAKKAKEEGKTEFEFNGKTYPVTLKD